MEQYRRTAASYPESTDTLGRNYSVQRKSAGLRGRTPLPREHYKRKHTGFRKILVWVVIGLLWQVPLYYFLNRQVAQVMFPSTAGPGLFAPRKAVFPLPAAQVTDPQVSYNDRYLAFQNNSTLNIYDFQQKKVVWQAAPRPNGKLMAYQWLPDREALLLFESGVGADPNRPGHMGVGIYSVEVAAGQNGVNERYAATLPPDLQWDKITQVSLSTATNLLFFSAENQGQNRLYEVDVMKNVKVVSWRGEQVAHLAVSPDRGAIYYDALDNHRWQVVAQKAGQRVQVASNPLDKVLGVWNKKLYMGTVQNGYLIKVWTITDNQPCPQRPDYSLHWQGKVPWDSDSSVSMSGQGLLVSSRSGVYRINSQGSALLAQGANFFSPSGKYYYTVKNAPSGMEIERNLV
ncbi:hypothetical protein CEB3_c04500 [Peptococcaceae bacterium CEB3]|nr:hypothetical protein CEB3_c04500 [Peptococcaceae bacterium CEB3]